MTQSANGRIPLSAVDFLKLAENKRISRVDLSAVGVPGVVYVCGLSTAQQQKMSGGKMRVYDDGSRDVVIPKEAATRMLLECMVTDGQDGALFESEFDQTDNDYITVPSDQLVYYRDNYFFHCSFPAGMGNSCCIFYWIKKQNWNTIGKPHKHQ